MPGFLGMCDVHELHEDLAHTRWSIPASDIRTGNHDLIDRSILLALLRHVPLQVLHKILIEEIFRVAHVEQLYDTTGYLAGGLVEQGELDIVIGDVFIGEQVGAEDVVGGTAYHLLQSGDVSGVGGETQTQSLVAQVGRVALQLLITKRHPIQSLHRLLSACMFLILQETVSFRYTAVSHQVEEFQLAKSLADLADLLIVKGEWESSEVELVISADGLKIILLEVLLLEEFFGLDDLEGILLVVEFGVGTEEILDSARGQGENGEGFGLVEFHITDGQWNGQFRVGCSDHRVKVLKDLLDGDSEGQVGADQSQRMVLSDGVLSLLFGRETGHLVQFRGQSQFFNLILIDILRSFSFFILLLFLFLLAIDERTRLFSLDD